MKKSVFLEAKETPPDILCGGHSKPYRLKKWWDSSLHFEIYWPLGAKETHPDILRGGHRNPYQLENALKSVETVFCIHHLG